ncbi:MAG: DPP IV N-terminal domain-containing protein, partial [Spirosomataceae bacterium]
MKTLLKLTLLFFIGINTFAQPGRGSHWTPDGNGYYTIKEGQIVLFDLNTQKENVVITKSAITPSGENTSLEIKDYAFTEDQSQALIFTNSKRVWRYETKGDYWVLNTKTNKLMQLGKDLPEASLMFAKFSPDGKKAAYVSERNVYVEDLATET